MKKLTIQTIFLSYIVFFAILTTYSIITPSNTTDLLTNQEIAQTADYDWVSKWNSSGITEDRFVDVALDSAGDIITTGWKWNPTNDIIVVKYDNAGNQLWNFSQNWGSWDTPNALAVDGTDIYVSVKSLISGKYKCYLAKINSSGSLEWNITWVKQGVSGVYSGDMALSSIGEFYVAGEMCYNPNVDYQYFIVKFNSVGEEVWNTTFGMHSADRKPIDAITISSDIIYVASRIRNESLSKDIPLLAKFNATTGEQIWNISWVPTGGDSGYIYDVIADSAGSIYITGESTPGPRLFLRKYNPDGALVWENSVINKNMAGYGLTIKDDNIIYVAGNMETGTADVVALLMKYSSDGTLLGYGTWSNDDASYSSARAVAVGDDNSTYLVGSTSGGSKKVAFIIKNLATPLNIGSSIPSFSLIGVICLIYAIMIIRRLKNKQTRRLR